MDKFFQLTMKSKHTNAQYMTCLLDRRHTTMVWRLSSNQEVVGSIPTRVRLWYFFTADQTCTEHSLFIYVEIRQQNIYIQYNQIHPT